MSISENEEALAYVFGLGKASPKEWHLREVTLEKVSKLICRTCSLTSLSHTGGAIASHLDIR